MSRNSWQARLVFGLVLWLSGLAHSAIIGSVSNTPQGMFIYHLSAAATDYMLLASAPFFLFGRISDDLQVLCLFSMIANMVGWWFYMSWLSPSTYNYSILIIGYIQYARLITAGIHGTDRTGEYFFHRLGTFSQKQNYEKAK